ncbi:MAG TPA: DNA primase noncatalytic subunit PriX [Sulfolobales archaeon]|nr:DNA primase noncatalytic subunit PriX [Sulfolobales archaeon]
MGSRFSGMVVAISDLSNYPFLENLEAFLEREGLPKSLEDLFLSTYAEAGYRRVVEDLDPRASMESPGFRDYRERILSFYIALALVSMTGDRRVYRAFAGAEAERVRRVLNDSDPEEIIDVMGRLGYSVERASERELCVAVGIDRSTLGLSLKCYAYKIPLADYLRIAAQIAIDEEYRLVNRPVSGGYVYVERETLVKLCTDIVRHRIEGMVKPIPPIEAAKRYLENILNIAREKLGEVVIETRGGGEQYSKERYLWIEKVVSKGLPDGRKRFILYVLTPYLATILKLEDEDAMKVVREFIDNSCRNYGKCEKVYDSWIRSCLRGARQKGIKPARIEKLDDELRKYITEIISQEI